MFWKKLLRVIFFPVVKLVIDEVGEKLEDPKDPYPKKE